GLLCPQGSQGARHGRLDRGDQVAASGDAGRDPRGRRDHRRLRPQGHRAGARARPQGVDHPGSGRSRRGRARDAGKRSPAGHAVSPRRLREMTGFRPRALLAVVLALLGGCTVQKQVRVDFSESQREYLPRDYVGVYQRWTRHDYAEHEVDKSLEVWGTFKSWEFREAYIALYASIYSLSDADRNKLRQSQHEAYQQAYEFHVTAQSAKWEWNDLEKPSSPWRVTLLDALGHELSAEKVRV